MKALFLTNVPSPYRVAFFNELGKRIELTVLFEKSTSDERDSSWKKYKFETFKGVFLKGRSVAVDAAFCPEVKSYLTKDWDAIIVANVSSPTGMLAIHTLRKRKIPYMIEGDGGFAKSGKGFKERIKMHFISGAKGYFSTSVEHDNYYLTYGAEKERIHRYPFTSISQKYIENAQEPFDKSALKEKLGITEEVIVLTVGRFVPIKGFDILLKAAKGMPGNVGIYFVGGEPTDEYLQLKNDLALDNVHFVGFMQSEQLMDYYRVADLFAMTSRGDVWGLVINEAMAFSLPIITTNRCIAGLELVREGQNGYIVPVDDIEKLHDAMLRILSAPRSIREAYGAESLQIIRGYTIEEMARQHIEILSMT